MITKYRDIQEISEVEKGSPGGLRNSWALWMLFLLAGSRWLLDGALPSAHSTALSAGVGCVTAAVLVLGWRRVRREQKQPDNRIAVSPDSRTDWKSPVAAAVLLTVPALSGAVSDRHLNANTATMALALSPVVVAVAVTAYTAGTELAGMLWPGLAGLAGLLLLLPVPDLLSWRADVALAAMPLVSGITACYLCFRGGGPQGATRQTMSPRGHWMERGLLLAGLIYGVLLLLEPKNLAFSWGASAVDGLISLLTLASLRRVGAVRWSAQFLLIPFVAILEGVILLRPVVTTRSWVGMILLLAGGGYLLLPRPQDSVTDSTVP